eukprot:g15905.t1
MGRRWATERVMMIALLLIGSEAFFLPLGGSRSPGTSAVAGRATGPLASQPAALCRVPGVRNQSRASRTRVCAGPLDDGFSTESDYDRFLGELIFSQSDVRDDVLKNLDKAGDDGFLVWLEKRIEDCEDLEERVGLKSLLDIIKQVKEYVDKALAEEEAEKTAAAAEAGGKKDGAVDAEVILTKAFRQKAKVVLTDGTETSDAPDVTPPKFIEAVKGIIRNFGNVGESELGFAQQLDDMIAEAEEVATDLYGETQSPQDLQDRAWKDTTVSVFDLENMEEDGALRGEEMPWANDQYDGMTPEMVKNFKKDSDGNLQIGGS